jgi:hypothetical protein
MSSIRQSLVYSKLASLRILQFRAWKGDQGMADGRWAVDGPKEVGLLPPINSAPKCWPN